MAVNIVATGTASTPSTGYGKPYYVPTTGRVYALFRKGTAGVGVYSFTLDDTSGIGTPENTDSANEIAATNLNNINSLTSFQDPANPNDLYAVAYGQDTGGDSCVEWWHFDATNTTNTANGSWIAGGQVIQSAMVRAAATGNNHAQMCVLSNGHKVCIYAGPTDTVKGTDYGRIYYTYHNGTAWQTPALVEGTTADQVQYQYPGLVLGKSDLVHFFWWNGTNYRTRSRTSGDTLNTAANIGSSNDSAQPPPAVYYLSGTDELIYYLHTASDGHPQYNLITNDGTPAADQEIDDVVVYDQGTAFQTSFQMSPNPDTGDLWAVYADSSTRDVWRVDDSAWGTATEIADGRTAEDVMMNVVKTDENAVILIAVFQDSTQMVAEYYVIAASGGSNAIAMTSNGTSTSNIALSVTRSLAVASDAVSTSNIALSVARSIALASDAVSTSNISLSVSVPIAITSDAVSTSNIALSISRALSLASDAVSTANIALSVSRSLSVASDATSTSNITLSVSKSLAVASDAVSTATIALSVSRALAVASDAVSTSNIALSVTRHIALASDAVSTSNIALTNQATGTNAIAIASDGVSTANIALSVSRSLVVASDATTTSNIALSVTRSLVVASDAVSTSNIALTNQATGSNAIAMTSDAVSTSTIGLTVTHSLSIASGAVSSATITLSNIAAVNSIALTADAVTTSNITLSVARSIVMVSDAVSVVNISLTNTPFNTADTVSMIEGQPYSVSAVESQPYALTIAIEYAYAVTVAESQPYMVARSEAQAFDINVKES